MATLSAVEASTIAHGSWAAGEPPSPLTSFAIDSRILEPGQTFIALKTDRRDGHAFLNNAREQGALAAIVQEPDPSVNLPQLVVEDTVKALHSLSRLWRQRFAAKVIGVSGSFGKTTVKELLGLVMGNQWYRTRGNLNNTLGVPLSILELDSHHDAGAILEAGINTTGEMEVLADLIDPDMAIITAVGPAHLEGLGSLDGVAREKARLAKAVRPGGDVILPLSLLSYSSFLEIPESVRVHAIQVNGDAEAEIPFDLSPNVTIYHYKWTDQKGSSRGLGRLLNKTPMPPGSYSFRAGSPGMVSNLALVVHTAQVLGVPDSTLQACLDSWRPFRYRGETYRHGDCVFYVDCYNANPGSMIDSVQRFQSLFPDKPQLYVLGSMEELGMESDKWHRDTGRQLSLPAEAEAYFIGPGSAGFRDGVEAGGHAAEQLFLTDKLESVEKRLSKFKGAVFLKASRRYGLEALLPKGARRC